MSDVECPHCKEEFDVCDHHDSGSYLCPNCDREIYIEVEYDVTYTASCMDDDHEFINSTSYPTWQFCQRCGKAKSHE